MSTKRGAPAPAVVGSHFVKQVQRGTGIEWLVQGVLSGTEAI